MLVYIIEKKEYVGGIDQDEPIMSYLQKTSVSESAPCIP